MNAQAFLENILPFKLSESQSSVLQKMEDFDRILITGKRQTGVTTLLVLDLARLILSNNPGKYLWACKHSAQFDYVLSLLKLLLNDQSLKLNSNRAIKFENGSEIFLMTDGQLKHGLRGRTFDVVYVDDCFHIKNLQEVIVLCHVKKQVLGSTEDSHVEADILIPAQYKHIVLS